MSDHWRPACELENLRLRAQMLAEIRTFFLQRQVMEVETPLLCRTTGTDPQLDFFATTLDASPNHTNLYLQTSPEFAMKRLLAAGSGSIYQICKAFRNGESGRFHNPEFTILEWYRVNFSLQQLMAEVSELLQLLLAIVGKKFNVRKISYQQFFRESTGLDPLSFDRPAYRDFTCAKGYPEADSLCGAEHVIWLDFIFSHCAQPKMPSDCIFLLHDYPAVLPSLARNNQFDPRIAERFEVFINAIELGNGFYELADPREQETRFDQEIALRSLRGLKPVAKDRLLLAALQAGLPECSGVAIGVDRLLMLCAGCPVIEEVLAFPLAKV
jgi:lysyl-tRNA synthetase class 2